MDRNGCRSRHSGLFTGCRTIAHARDRCPTPTSRPLLVAGAVIAVALAGTVLLWAHYGATVFFETIRAGFAACFG